MIIKIISKYLENNKRLVVPNLGAFIVKDAEHKILFSNLMKGDDGVLRKLLIEHGVSELEAAGTIDRFVFEVNFRLDRDGVCGLDKFGALKRGANGIISFITNPAAQGEVLDGGLEEHLAEGKKSEPALPSRNAEPAANKAEAVDEEEEMVIRVVPKSEPTVEPKPKRQVQSQSQKETLTVSSQKRPASYVKGLQYGKGGKIITGREYATSRESSKGDVFIKIAIAVAVIAVLALLYGFWCDWRNSRYDDENYSVESVDEVNISAERTITNPDLEYITPKK